MLRKMLIGLGVLVPFAMGLSGVSMAAVPPPPVNQNLGIPDGVFNNLEESDCRGCHEDATVVDDANIPDRHHNLVGTTMPDPTAAPNGTPGDPYECLSCHSMVYNDTTGAYEFQTFRDCLVCHQQISGEASVHHLSTPAQDADCQHCHGSLVDNKDDGHYVPDYAPTSITPWPSGKPNSGANGEGNCDFCHTTNAAHDSTPVVDPDSGASVYLNADTHHSTGFGLDTTKCIWCHDTSAPEGYAIRQCENCHAVNSLHNIEFDNVGDGISVGEEAAYYGHIGAQDDCWGCHGYTSSASSSPYGGSIIPWLDSLSVRNATSGISTPLTISGSGFINDDVDPNTGEVVGTQVASVALRNASGDIIEVQTDSVTPDTIELVLPANLVPGNYQVTAYKESNFSNPIVLAVKPPVVIDSAVCGESLTINGNGFSDYVDAENLDIGVSISRTVTIGKRKSFTKTFNSDCSVGAWNDDVIEASCGRVCCGVVKVQSIYGEATYDLGACSR